MFLCTCNIQLWPPCRNFLIKTPRTFCWNSGNDEKLIRFPRNLIVKTFIWTCTMKFWQACRNIVGKNTKSNRKNQKRWVFFWTILFFFLIKNDSLATENAILTTLAKFFSKYPLICSSDSENDGKYYEFFERKKTFLKKCLCTRKIQLWPPRPEKSRQNSENYLLEIQNWWKNSPLSKKNYFSPKRSSEHAQRRYGKPAVTLLPRIRKLSQTPKMLKLQFFEQNYFFLPETFP